MHITPTLGLSCVLAAIQLVWLVFIISRLRKQHNLGKRHRPISTVPVDVRSRLDSTIPTFNKTFQGKLWSKINQSQKASGQHDTEDQLYDSDSSVKIHCPDNKSDANYRRLSGSSQSTDASEMECAKEASKLLAEEDGTSSTPSQSQPQIQLVLPIYQRCLKLQALYSVSWCALNVILITSGSSIVESYPSAAAPTPPAPSSIYIFGVSALAGLGALLDAVVIFLSRNDVGRKAIYNSERLAYIWGLANFAISFGLSTYGREAAGPESKFYTEGHIPLWDPLFVRAFLLLVFTFLCFAINISPCTPLHRGKPSSLTPDSVGHGSDQGGSSEHPGLREAYDNFILTANKEEQLMGEDTDLEDRVQMLNEIIRLLEDQKPTPARDETLDNLKQTLRILKLEGRTRSSTHSTSPTPSKKSQVVEEHLPETTPSRGRVPFDGGQTSDSPSSRSDRSPAQMIIAGVAKDSLRTDGKSERTYDSPLGTEPCSLRSLPVLGISPSRSEQPAGSNSTYGSVGDRMPDGVQEARSQKKEKLRRSWCLHSC